MDSEQIEPLVTDNYPTLFRCVVLKRTKRIILYNIKTDKPDELVCGAVKTYSEQ